jgi:hypothetical protein
MRRARASGTRATRRARRTLEIRGGEREFAPRRPEIIGLFIDLRLDIFHGFL